MYLLSVKKGGGGHILTHKIASELLEYSMNLNLKKKNLKIPVIILIIALLATLTLTVLGQINPMIFWILAGLSAIFAFKILPKMG